MDYEGIKYHRNMRCPVCRTLLARKFAYSFVLDLHGKRIDVWGIGGLTYEEMQASYEIPCHCGGGLIFSTPDEADQ